MTCLATEDSVYALSWGIDLQGSRYFELAGFYDSTGPNPEPHPGRRVHVATGDVVEAPLTEIGYPFLSPTGRYIAHRIPQDDGPLPFAVTVEDRSTGQTVTLADPFSGNYPGSPEVLWSPSADMPAVRYYRFGGLGDPAHTGLAVYTPDGRLLHHYYDLYGIDWAADGQSLLVSTQDDAPRRPCLLTLADNAISCLDEIADWAAAQSVDLGAFHLSPDGRQVAFSYWTYSEDSRSGLCLFDLDSGDINCPIDGATLGQDVFLRGFTWSPDGRYLALLIDLSPPGSDDLTMAQLATVSVDGHQYRVLGKTVGRAAWRPFLPASPPG